MKISFYLSLLRLYTFCAHAQIASSTLTMNIMWFDNASMDGWVDEWSKRVWGRHYMDIYTYIHIYANVIILIYKII